MYSTVVSVVGRYNIVLDESHFSDILHQLVSPPPATVYTFSFSASLSLVL